MTRIYCSAKLKSFIGKVQTTLPDDYAVIKPSDWNAHLFYVDKRKCILFIHIPTYYMLFISDIVKKDMKDIDDIFRERLKQQLIHDNLTNWEMVMNFIAGSKLTFITTNNNKSILGKINNYVDKFKIHRDYKYPHLDEMDVVHENGLFNGLLSRKLTNGKEDYRSPASNLLEYINELI